MPSGEQAALAAQYMAQQRLLSTTLTRDMVILIRALFSFNDPGASWPGLKMAADAMIRDRRRTSADLAGPYYQRARLMAGATGHIVPAEPLELAADRVDATLNATGIATFQEAIKAGADPPKARDRMAVTFTGSASMMALEGGRQVVHETVQEDDEAIGWARVGDGDPCAFCAMLISRGVVYRSAKTAGRNANKRFVGEGMFKFHNHDGCQAIPVFDPEDPVLKQADDLYDQWLAQTSGHSGKAAIREWRRYWDNRDSGEGSGSDQQAG